MFEFISKQFADIKILHEGYTADYFLNRMKTNTLFPILFIQNNLLKKKSGTVAAVEISGRKDLNTLYKFRNLISVNWIFIKDYKVSVSI
jgi:hypothetical protein